MDFGIILVFSPHWLEFIFSEYLIYIFRFFSLVTNAAQMVRKDSHLSNIFHFGWLDGNEIANNVVLGTVDQPGK